MPPAPGNIPSLVSGSPTRASEEKTRKLVHKAISNPPPKAGPLTAEIVGMERVSRAEKVERRWVRKERVSEREKERRSFRSAPAQKMEGVVDVRIRARVEEEEEEDSEAMARMWVEREVRRVVEIALRARGRFKERILMVPAWGAGREVRRIGGGESAEL